MKQNRQVILMVAMAVFLAIGGPFWLARKQAAGLDVKTAQTRSEAKALRTKIDQAKVVKRNRPNYTQALDIAHSAMPSDNDIKGAILTLQSLAEATKVEWVSFSIAGVVKPDVAAAAPATTGSTSTVPAKTKQVTATTKAPATYSVGGFDINVAVKGTRSDILTYLGKVRDLPSPARLFVVTGVTMDFSRGGVGNAAVAGDVQTEAQLTLHAVGFGAPPTTVADGGATAGKAPTTSVVAGATPQPAPVATVAPVVTVAAQPPAAQPPAVEAEPPATTVPATPATDAPAPPDSEA
jgi:hypothetical protein